MFMDRHKTHVIDACSLDQLFAGIGRGRRNCQSSTGQGAGNDGCEPLQRSHWEEITAVGLGLEIGDDEGIKVGAPRRFIFRATISVALPGSLSKSPASSLWTDGAVTYFPAWFRRAVLLR